MTAELPRRLIAEAIGTGILVFFGAGAVVAASTFGRGAADYAALGMIALAFAIAIAVAVHAFGDTSGAHLNPAVTVALAVTRRFPMPEVVPYVIAQVAGALAAALLIVLVFGETAAVDRAAVGATVVSDDINYLQGIIAEAVGTFLLLTAVMALAVDRRAPGGWAALMIGLSVAVGILALGPLTGGSLNPARTFGPLFLSTVFGGDTNWGDLPLYIIGPLLGAVAAAIAYDYVARPREGATRSPRVQGTQGEVTGTRRADPAAAAAARQGTQGEVTGVRRADPGAAPGRRGVEGDRPSRPR